MALAANLANDHATTHEICKRCVGGLNQIDAFISNAEVDALSGGSADDDLLALITTNSAAATRHNDDYQIGIQVNAALQAAIDAGVINASDVAGCSTKAALKALFVTADPLGLVAATTTSGDAWRA